MKLFKLICELSLMSPGGAQMSTKMLTQTSFKFVALTIIALLLYVSSIEMLTRKSLCYHSVRGDHQCNVYTKPITYYLTCQG